MGLSDGGSTAVDGGSISRLFINDFYLNKSECAFSLHAFNPDATTWDDFIGVNVSSDAGDVGPNSFSPPGLKSPVRPGS